MLCWCILSLGLVNWFYLQLWTVLALGSSAGAGSGEFHVYRHLRRREYQRQDYMDAMAEKVSEPRNPVTLDQTRQAGHTRRGMCRSLPCIWKGSRVPFLPSTGRLLCNGTAGQGFHTVVLLPLFPLHWAECLIQFIVVSVDSVLDSQRITFPHGRW